MSENNTDMKESLSQINSNLVELRVALYGDKDRQIPGIINHLNRHETRLYRLEVIGFSVLIIAASSMFGSGGFWQVLLRFF